MKIEIQSMANAPLSTTCIGAMFAMPMTNMSVLMQHCINNEWLLLSTSQKTDNNVDNFGNSMSSPSNDGNRIVTGADHSDTIFFHDNANHKHIDMFVNQPLFD